MTVLASALTDEELERHLDEVSLDACEFLLDLSGGEVVVGDVARGDAVEVLLDIVLVLCPRRHPVVGNRSEHWERTCGKVSEMCRGGDDNLICTHPRRRSLGSSSQSRSSAVKERVINNKSSSSDRLGERLTL